MDLFYTYIWKDASGVPFYVGKGKGSRAKVTRNRSAEFRAEYEKGGCTVEIVDEFTLNSQANAHEMYLIATYGRRSFGGLLVNKTDGGDGTSGSIRTSETRASISASLLGVKHTKERRENISSALTGRELTAEHRAKIGSALKGKPKSKEHRDNVVSAILAPEVRAKKSIASLRRWADPVKKEATIVNLRMKGPRSDNTSGFKGVSFDKASAKWNAYIQLDGRRQSLGYFPDAETGARAYDAAAIESGIKCYLNFPPDAANDNGNTNKETQ